MKNLILSVALLMLAACSAENPRVQGQYPAQKPKPVYPVPQAPKIPDPPVFPDVKQPDKPADWQSFERDFAFFPSEATAEQSKHNENQMSLFFQVQKDGNSVNNLTAPQLSISENGTKIGNFKLGVADREKFNQAVDIMFLVDVTRSMGPFIETAKKVLKDFIRTSAEKGYHTRMCISTFGDYTVKFCTRFFDNNPKDTTSKAQVRELLNELASLHAARTAAEDPGGDDVDENPMGSLIDASKAPWGADSQRFVIVVTDAPFLYSPTNQGQMGEKAPTMIQTNEAIKAAQMKVFAVTPSHAGYNSPFQDQPGIVQSSGGEFFEFDQVLKGRVSLSQILERILLRVNTTYKVNYVIEQNGLNPTLPVDQRQVQVQVTDANLGTVGKISVQSSVPTGREEYKTSFVVADSPIAPETMQVTVSGQAAPLPSTEYTVNGGEVRFNHAPAAGAKLKFTFQYQAAEKNLRVVPMTLPAQLNAKNTTVFLNDIQARAEDLIFATDAEKGTTLTVGDAVLGPNDPYQVRQKQRLKIKAVLAQ